MSPIFNKLLIMAVLSPDLIRFNLMVIGLGGLITAFILERIK